MFLDEIFKSNSAILNSLLHVINERKFQNGPEVVQVPLISLYAASNEVPNDENLAAMFDRFLVRVLSDNLDSYHFHELMKKGMSLELRKMTGRGVDAAGKPTGELRPVITARDLRQIQQNFDKFMVFPEEFLTKYKGLDLPDPQRGHLGLGSPRGQAAQAVRRDRRCSMAARACTTATSSSCATSGTTSTRSSCSRRSSTRWSTRTTASIRTSAGSSARRRASTTC